VVPDFEPGQFVKLGLPRSEEESAAVPGPQRARSTPRLIRRAYSIASSIHQRAYLEFLMVRVQVGKLTPKLWTLDPGGRVWMDDKVSGRFTLEPIPPEKDIVMVATGTGIAPFVSILRTYADAPRWRRAVVINGVRYAADLAYRAELEALARDHAHIVYIPIVSREPTAWAGLGGRVQQVLDPHAYRSLVGAVLSPHDCHVMLCGNPEMIVSVQRMLETQGFHVHSPTQPGNIHFERYW
jgi:ferredoxin--NADP+ reductase